MTPKEQADKWFTQFGDRAKDQIDGMLKSRSLYIGSIGYSELVYWNEVKREIENIKSNEEDEKKLEEDKKKKQDPPK